MSRENTKATSVRKEAWIKPEVKEMNVAKVSENNPGVGPDGSPFGDCTFS